MKSKQIEVEDRFTRICEEFIDGNHPTKILHKSWNEKFVQIMGSISQTSLRRQQMVLNLLTSADLTDDQRSKVFNALETCTMAKLPFLEMTEDLLPSCNPLEFDPDSLMKKADLKLRHNGISKSWNLITSASTLNHQFAKEQIMDYIGGDEDFNFLELYKKFVEFDIFSHFDFYFFDRFKGRKNDDDFLCEERSLNPKIIEGIIKDLCRGNSPGSMGDKMEHYKLYLCGGGNKANLKRFTKQLSRIYNGSPEFIQYHWRGRGTIIKKESGGMRVFINPDPIIQILSKFVKMELTHKNPQDLFESSITRIDDPHVNPSNDIINEEVLNLSDLIFH